jgi:myo-inositol-1(or 4)-monophosphatase
MITEIDGLACANLMRGVTDTIAREGPRSAREAPIVDLIAQVRAVGTSAKLKLRVALANLYPTIGWIDEEERPNETNNAYWLFDPIDGAYHYLQGLPLWSSSLALVRDDRVLFSAVYDPGLGKTFMAVAGQGAMLNGAPIRVSPKADLAAAVVGTSVPPLAQVGGSEHDLALALVGCASRAVFVVRPMASASLQLAYVAAGRLDGYWETGRDAADWLAGSLLITEAGGVVTDLQGEAFGWTGDGVVAASPRLHAALLPVLAGSGRRRAEPSVAP